jgi:putative FmdB family regulatory protein
MPIFEYLCEDCGTKFEKLIRNGGASELVCPSCGQKHLEQQLSTFAAHANGSSKESAFPSCPSGMCQTPDLCGRN